MKDMNNDIAYIMINEEQLDAKVSELAAKINEDYKDSKRRILLVGILKGSVVFLTELMKKITLPVEIDFMKVSSYGPNMESTGFLDVTLDLTRKDLPDVDILVVEDIADSGRTLVYLKQRMLKKGANSVRTCTLLDKPQRRKVQFEPDYFGFLIEDEFVVGYGLDYDEKYRNLPYIGVLKPSVYEKK